MEYAVVVVAVVDTYAASSSPASSPTTWRRHRPRQRAPSPLARLSLFPARRLPQRRAAAASLGPGEEAAVGRRRRRRGSGASSPSPPHRRRRSSRQRPCRPLKRRRSPRAMERLRRRATSAVASSSPTDLEQWRGVLGLVSGRRGVHGNLERHGGERRSRGAAVGARCGEATSTDKAATSASFLMR